MMTKEEYLKRLDFYLDERDRTVVNVGILTKTVIRLARRKIPEEIEEFEKFIEHLILNDYLNDDGLKVLNMFLIPVKNLLEAKADETAKQLRS